MEEGGDCTVELVVDFDGEGLDFAYLLLRFLEDLDLRRVRQFLVFVGGQVSWGTGWGTRG